MGVEQGLPLGIADELLALKRDLTMLNVQELKVRDDMFAVKVRIDQITREYGSEAVMRWSRAHRGNN